MTGIPTSPLPWCLQWCFLPFQISGGSSLQEPSSGLQGKRQPGPSTQHLLLCFSVTEQVTDSAVLPASSLPPALPTTLCMQIHPGGQGSDISQISNLVPLIKYEWPRNLPLYFLTPEYYMYIITYKTHTIRVPCSASMHMCRWKSLLNSNIEN